jgi:hypothetical protein
LQISGLILRKDDFEHSPPPPLQLSNSKNVHITNKANTFYIYISESLTTCFITTEYDFIDISKIILSHTLRFATPIHPSPCDSKEFSDCSLFKRRTSEFRTLKIKSGDYNPLIRNIRPFCIFDIFFSIENRVIWISDQGSA